MGRDEQRRLFEPIPASNRLGTGLGLAIVFQIVRQHGGDITVRSAADQGTQFDVRLPLVPGLAPRMRPSAWGGALAVGLLAAAVAATFARRAHAARRLLPAGHPRVLVPAHGRLPPGDRRGVVAAVEPLGRVRLATTGRRHLPARLPSDVARPPPGARPSSSSSSRSGTASSRPLGAGALAAARSGSGGRRPATAGGAYALSGPLLSALSLFHHYAGAAWLPWLLLRAGGAPDAGRAPRRRCGSGLVAGAQLLAGSGDMCLAGGILGRPASGGTSCARARGASSPSRAVAPSRPGSPWRSAPSSGCPRPSGPARASAPRRTRGPTPTGPSTRPPWST